ncbi:MAG TPA: hypothetical protein VGR21_13615 [Cryptosporangiaceae bacterium]|nr:hypothetical protein [Cryptosporangiaceae bacterium]
MHQSPPERGQSWGNSDIDWDAWPVQQYLAESYRELHPLDAAVIEHHSAFYRTLPPDSIDRSVEVGAGPNLYPLMLPAAASRQVEAVEYGAANVAYLRGQLARSDESWQPFYARCRELNSDLPGTLAEALSRVEVVPGNALDLPPGHYGLASMHFVAEGATENFAEFERFCRAFVRCVRPGGFLVAAFMENMARYALGDHSEWPGFPVDQDTLRRVFAPHVEELVLDHIDPDPTLPAYGYTGVLVMTARRSGGTTE